MPRRMIIDLKFSVHVYSDPVLGKVATTFLQMSVGGEDICKNETIREEEPYRDAMKYLDDRIERQKNGVTMSGAYVGEVEKEVVVHDLC